MKSTRIILFAFTGLCLFFVAACASTHSRYSRPEDFVAPMEKLSARVDGKLHDPFSTTTLAGAALLASAMEGKTNLQEAFRKTSLLITNQGDKALIIMLSLRNTNVVWLEDATWTPKVDKFHFQSNPPSPVLFTIPFPSNP